MFSEWKKIIYFHWIVLSGHPTNPELLLICRFPDYEVLKLWKGRPGKYPDYYFVHFSDSMTTLRSLKAAWWNIQQRVSIYLTILLTLNLATVNCVVIGQIDRRTEGTFTFVCHYPTKKFSPKIFKSHIKFFRDFRPKSNVPLMVNTLKWLIFYIKPTLHMKSKM